MIELITALVLILALTAGLLQIASLGRAHTEVMLQARREAGLEAMAEVPALEWPDYVLDWAPGPDGKRITRDDELLTDNPAPFDAFIVEQAGAGDEQWAVLEAATNDALPSLRGDPDPVLAFGLVRGHDDDDVPLISAVQSLFYQADSIAVEGEVWLTHTRGIY